MYPDLKHVKKSQNELSLWTLWASTALGSYTHCSVTDTTLQNKSQLTSVTESVEFKRCQLKPTEHITFSRVLAVLPDAGLWSEIFVKK